MEQKSIKQDNTKKEIEAISKKLQMTKLKPSDLIIPLSIGGILILLTIFVFVPMISSALEYRKELKEVEGKIESLEKLNKSLDSMDESVLSDDVIAAKAVIPKVLKVSDFIYYVDNLAKQEGLAERELSAGDTGSTETSNSVSGPVEYSGKFDNVISFLDKVQDSSPYLISIKNVELSGADINNWSVSLNINGYYLSDTGADSVNIYAPFKVYTEYSDILQIFKEKSESID